MKHLNFLIGILAVILLAAGAGAHAADNSTEDGVTVTIPVSCDLGGTVGITRITKDAPKPLPSRLTLKDKKAGYCALVFSEPGTYEYRFKQKAGKDKSISYDLTPYKVTVYVLDSGGGLKPVITVMRSGEKSDLVHFANTKTSSPAVQKPSPGTPSRSQTVKTGDARSPWQAAGIGALIVICFILLLRKKRGALIMLTILALLLTLFTGADLYANASPDEDEGPDVTVYDDEPAPSKGEAPILTVQYDGNTDKVTSSEIAASYITEDNAVYQTDTSQGCFYYDGTVPTFDYTLGQNSNYTRRTKRVHFKPSFKMGASLATGTLTNPYTVTYQNAAELKNGRKIDMVIKCTAVSWKAVRFDIRMNCPKIPAELDGAVSLYTHYNNLPRPMFETSYLFRSGSNSYLYRIGARQTFTVSFKYHDSGEPVDVHIAYSIFDVDNPDHLVSPAAFNENGFTEGIILEGGQEDPVHVVVPQKQWLLNYTDNHFYASAADDVSYKSGFVVNGSSQTSWTWIGSNCGTALDVAYTKGGGVRIHKLSSAPTVTENDEHFSLSDAVYTLYRDEKCTQEAGFTFTTEEQKTIWNDNEGFAASTLDIPEGTYYLKETDPPKGFVRDDNVYPVSVEKGSFTDITVEDEPALLSVEYKSDPHGTITGKSEETVREGEHPTGSTEKATAPYHTVDDEHEAPAAWTCDHDVTLDDPETGETIKKGDYMTMDQIKRVIVQEHLIFTVHHEMTPEYPNPVKSASVSEASVGDEYTYTVSQHIHEDGVDYDGSAYRTELIITDELPEETDYVDAHAYLTEKGSDEAAVSLDGGLSYDKDSHTLTWSDYASQKEDGAFDGKGIDLEGGTVVIVITVRANKASAKAGSWDNDARTFVDKKTLTSNKVTVTGVNLYSLTVSKSVAGNFADRTKKFAFTLEIEDAAPETEYPVRIESTSSSGGADSSGSTEGSGGADGSGIRLATDEDGAGSVTFRLSHKERAVIEDLPEETVFSISENADGYKPSFTITSDSGSSSEASNTTGNITLEDDAAVAFVNVRRISVPTGIAGDSRWLDALMVIIIAALAWKAVMLKVKQ